MERDWGSGKREAAGERINWSGSVCVVGFDRKGSGDSSSERVVNVTNSDTIIGPPYESRGVDVDQQ